MKNRFLKLVICKLFGHKLIYSPQFCQRCHFDGQYYPVKFIKKTRPRRWTELTREESNNVLMGKPIYPKPVEYYKKIFI